MTEVANNKNVKYICYQCGLQLKAPIGLNIKCPKCVCHLETLPTNKKDFEYALGKAYERVTSFSKLNESLRNELREVYEQLNEYNLKHALNKEVEDEEI